MDRERPHASDSEEKIPEAWIGREIMLETTEVISSDLRAGAPGTWRTSMSGASSCWWHVTTVTTSPTRVRATSIPGA
jgi:hypothetical protein